MDLVDHYSAILLDDCKKYIKTAHFQRNESFERAQQRKGLVLGSCARTTDVVHTGVMELIKD